MTLHLLILLFCLKNVYPHEEGIFKLPELTVATNNTYLIRKEATRLTCQITGDEWSEAVLDRVSWVKDGTPVSEVNQKHGHTGLSEHGDTLRVIEANHNNEGDYQCSAIVRNIRLSDGRFVWSHLVSAPIKLRRARITKFERYITDTIRVRQGQVARLPCFGLPDVIPGPPEIWFEKQGQDGVPLGRTGNERFIATHTGLQIAITQPSDAGRYFCVVRNTYTNQTRKAPRPIILMVEPNQASYDLLRPRIIYPETFNYSEPVPLHVVAGQAAILECVIWDAKVVWNKADYSLQQISLTDDRARIRQIWGNLRIKSVSISDAGEYECHGVSPLDSSSNFDLLRNDHPKVRYQLIVHASTNVRLMLAQQVQDKSWQLSCYAHNLRYEIPMVYVNGLALIDAMEEMGVPPQTNFYTNPINVTLQANNPLSGSIQCISRPAMEEAEIYGVGLERGRAMNLYVDARMNEKQDLISQGPKNMTLSVGQNAALTCVTVAPSVKVHWLKDAKLLNLRHNHRFKLIGSGTLEIFELRLEDQGLYTCEARNSSSGIETSRENAMLFVEQIKTTTEEDIVRFLPTHFLMSRLTIKKPRAFVTGHNARIQWSLPSNHPDLARLAKFRIEYRHQNQTSWSLGEQVQIHVRATTIRRLTPGFMYIFRVVAILDDGTTIESELTDWLKIERSPSVAIIPTEPQIIRLQTVSHSSMLVAWNYSAIVSGSEAEKFIISYAPTNGKNDPKTIEVSSESLEILLTDLEPSTEYRVTIIAENEAGKSPPSPPRRTKTFELSPDFEKDTGFWARMKKNFGDFSPAMSIKFVVMMFSASIAVCLLILLCCLTCCQLKDWHERQRARRKAYEEHGAHNIYSDQGYRKPKAYKQRPMFNTDPIDELSPLNYHEQYDDKKDKSPATSTTDDNSGRLRLESKPAPSLYGNVHESMYSVNGSKMSLEMGQHPRSEYVNTSTNGGYANNPTYADLTLGLYRMNGLRGSLSTMKNCSALSSREHLPQSTLSPFRSISSATGAAYSSYLPKRGILSYSPDEYSSSVLDSNSTAPLLTNGSNGTRNQLSQSPDSLLNGQNNDPDIPKTIQESRQPLSTFKSSDSPNLTYLTYGTLDRKRLYGSSRGGSTMDMMRSITRLSDD